MALQPSVQEAPRDFDTEARPSFPRLGDQPSQMDTRAFLDLVLPVEGRRVVAVKAAERGMHQDFPTDNASAVDLIETADTPGSDVYFGCASMREPGSRKGANAAAVRSFWLDLDCGEGKPYASAAEAALALREFCRDVELPKPLVVSSGFGLHVYWPVTEDLRPGEWLATATLLKEACVRQGLRADPTRTADVASVLRPPGSTHRKDGERPVTVLREAPPVEHAAIRAALEAYLGMAATHDPSDWLAQMPDHVRTGLHILTTPANDLCAGVSYPPAQANRIADQCGVLALIRETRGLVDQPTWYHSLQVLAKCEDGYEFAHEWSKGDPRYTAAEVERTLDRLEGVGPTTCKKFKECQPAICGACTLNVSSPIVLGTEPAPAAPSLHGQLGASPFGVDQTVANLSASARTAVVQSRRLSTLLASRPFYRRRPEHGGLFHIGDISILNAPGGVGKTTLLIGIALALASGMPLLGQPVARRRRVLLVSLEEQLDEMLLKLRAALEYHQSRCPLPGDVAEWITVLGAGDLHGLTFTRSEGRRDVVNQDGLDLFRQSIADAEADIAIVDPVMMLFPSGMNDNGLVYATALEVKRIAADLSCAILLSAHTKKGGLHGAEGVDGAEAILGAVALSNAARVVKGLSRITAETAAAIGVPYGDEGGIREIVDQKANFSPAGTGQYVQIVGRQVANALPPDYPDGDWVGVAAPFMVQPGARSVPSAALRDALVALARGAHGGTAPYSQAKQAGPKSQSRYFGPDLACAIAAHFPQANPARLEQAAKDVFKDVCDRGWAEVVDVRIGSNKRKGIRVKWSATPWATEPAPSGPWVA